MTHVLSFRCEYIDGGTASVMPCIDGTALADLVAGFERENGYTDPAGGYGGIVPSRFNLGPLPFYFLGNEEPTAGDRAGKIYVLFCDCGEAGCWPLFAHVRSNGQSVTWEDFSQPYRPQRDYSGFGPFNFARADYEQAVAIAATFEDIE